MQRKGRNPAAKKNNFPFARYILNLFIILFCFSFRWQDFLIKFSEFCYTAFAHRKLHTKKEKKTSTFCGKKFLVGLARFGNNHEKKKRTHTKKKKRKTMKWKALQRNIFLNSSTAWGFCYKVLFAWR